MHAERVGEQRDRGTHLQALVRAQRIVHRLPFPPCSLHRRHSDLSCVAFPPLLPDGPVDPCDLPMQCRAVRRHDPQDPPVIRTCLLARGDERTAAIDRERLEGTRTVGAYCREEGVRVARCGCAAHADDAEARDDPPPRGYPSTRGYPDGADVRPHDAGQRKAAQRINLPKIARRFLRDRHARRCAGQAGGYDERAASIVRIAPLLPAMERRTGKVVMPTGLRDGMASTPRRIPLTSMVSRDICAFGIVRPSIFIAAHHAAMYSWESAWPFGFLPVGGVEASGTS